MTFSRDPYQIAILKNEPIEKREIAYYRQRFLHSVFEKIILKFVQRAEQNGITKSKIAKLTGKDPGQINKLLSLPSNLTLEMISDLSLALGCEPEISLEQFDVDPRHNFTHSSMQRYLNSRTEKHVIQGSSSVKITNESVDARAKSPTNGRSLSKIKSSTNLYETA